MLHVQKTQYYHGAMSENTRSVFASGTGTKQCAENCLYNDVKFHLKYFQNVFDSEMGWCSKSMHGYTGLIIVLSYKFALVV